MPITRLEYIFWLKRDIQQVKPYIYMYTYKGGLNP